MKNLFVFDIETVVDLEAAKNLLSLESMTPDYLIRQELENYHLNLTDGKNGFHRQPFHKIVAISFLEAEITKDEKGFEFFTLKDIRSGGKVDSSERDLVAGFFAHLAQIKPRLVSFNGRTFDMPVLKYRAMLHGVDSPWFYKSGDKWNGYNNRYSADWHCDLLDSLSDYGASARVKLNEVCAMFGYPGKMDVDGGQVQDMYDAGKIKEIRDYCELDVINTYLVYLRFAAHNGIISRQGLVESAQDLMSYMESNSDEKPHYGDFLNEWLAKDREFTKAA